MLVSVVLSAVIVLIMQGKLYCPQLFFSTVYEMYCLFNIISIFLSGEKSNGRVRK